MTNFIRVPVLFLVLQACLAIATPVPKHQDTDQIEPPRLRTLLANGSKLLVENQPKSKSVCVDLFASSLRVPDTPENHGYKHLLEHLILKGPNKDLDQRMETQGIFFTGDTLRDAMQIQVWCGADQIAAALDCLTEVLKPLHVTQQEIVHEVEIMRQESALAGDPQRLDEAEWKLAYGDRGLSPFGDLGIMAKATPDDLLQFQKSLFSANNLVLVISGPLDVEAVTIKAKQFLSQCGGKDLDEPDPRPAGVPGRTNVDAAFGEARAARVGGFDEEKTAWALAAGLAIAAKAHSAFFTYTPSADNGLIIVGKTDETSGLGLMIDALEPGDMSAMFPSGKILAKRWVLRQLESPDSSAFIRGILLCIGPSYKPEDLLETIDKMNWKQFFDGIAMFGKSNTDIAVGAR